LNGDVAIMLSIALVFGLRLGRVRYI
jgi:hypothetical protein